MKETVVNLVKFKNIDEKRTFIRNLLDEAGSQFVTVEFTKVDGTNRIMTVQNEALKNLVKGEDITEAAKKAVETRKRNNPNLMAAYDVNLKEIRSINLDTTHAVRTNGKDYRFEQKSI